MANFSLIFSPFTIGGLRLKNRILMAAMGNNFSDPQGTVSNRAIAYYAQRARGGAGLIITEASPVSPSGKHRRRGLCAFDDSFLPGLRRLVTSIHAQGSAIALQLHHAGRLADPEIIGSSPLAPSPVSRGVGWPSPQEMNLDEIQEVIHHFGSAGRRAKEAGFDAVEVHGAHGYLIHQFLSPRTNQRRDQYGGSTEKRALFALEVLKRVRNEVGESFPIFFRLSAKEFLKDGFPLEDALDWAAELERSGASALHVSGGTTESLVGSAHVIPPMVFPEGYHVPLAEAIKKKVRIPIIAVGRLGMPEVAERVLLEGQADLVAVGRAFLSDPHWPLKLARGEKDRIRPCVACNYCLGRIFQQEELACFQNATVGNEESFQILPAEKAKKVFIIGGGPGGMEAARVARERGHRVTLLEKTSSLGGQILLASIPPHKENLLKAVEWLIREIKRGGVEIRLNTEGNEKIIGEEKPDALVLATGARPLIPDTFSASHVLTAWEVLGGEETGEEVIILGGGMVGMETAEFLSQKGCRVTVVEMLEKPASDMEGTGRALLLERISSRRISVLLSTRVEKMENGRVLVKTPEGEKWLDAESVILALGSESNQKVLSELKGKVSQLIAIGDCLEPRRAREAIHEGFRAALQL